MVKKPLEKKPLIKPVDINRLIDKGAPVKEESDSKKWTCINLRFPTKLLNEIDETVEKLVGFSRTGWILQTLQKEIKRLNDNPDITKDD